MCEGKSVGDLLWRHFLILVLIVVQAFAEAGCRHLVLVYRDEPRLLETVKTLGLDDARITLHAVDIRDDEAVEKLVGEIPTKNGSLDYAL